MKGWQPIKTAPKDGTVILLYVRVDGGDYATASWNGRYWSMGVHNDYMYDGFGAPTHWMPLPDPPQIAPLGT